MIRKNEKGADDSSASFVYLYFSQMNSDAVSIQIPFLKSWVLPLVMIGVLPFNASSQTIAAGDWQMVAICNDGSRSENTLQSWGCNKAGMLGDGSNTDSNVPVNVSSLSDVSSISCNGWHTLALKSDGTVWIWGFGLYGQFGNGTTESSNIPVQMNNMSDVSSISAGQYHSFAIKNDGTVWGWGYNISGQLGIGNDSYILEPVLNTSLTSITAIAAGSVHTLALKEDGTLLAWGNNYDGQLGNGETGWSYSPVEVNTLTGITAISAGMYHSLALKEDSTVWAWGSTVINGNVFGSNSPTQINSLTGIVDISAGKSFSMALKSDGTVWTWGYNNGYGQIGNGSDTSSYYPQQVIGLYGVIEIEAGQSTSMVKKDDGTVWTWGRNDHGQLGDGTTTNSSVPVQVIGLCGAVKVDDTTVESIGISVYPNPLQNELSVKGTKRNATITLFDNSGNEVLKQLSAEYVTRINTASLAAGIYVLKYVGENDITSMRIVKY